MMKYSTTAIRFLFLSLVLSVSGPALTANEFDHKDVVTLPVQADSSFSGSWFTPNLEGSGITLQIIGTGDDATILVHLMTFDETGIPVWLVSQVRAGDALIGPAWRSGYQMDVNAIISGKEVEVVGSLRLYFYDGRGLYVYAWIEDGIIDPNVQSRLEQGVNMLSLTKFTSD